MKAKKAKTEKTLKQRAKDYAISQNKAATKNGKKTYMTVESPKGPKQVDFTKYIEQVQQRAYIKGANDEREFLKSLQDQIFNHIML